MGKLENINYHHTLNLLAVLGLPDPPHQLVVFQPDHCDDHDSDDDDYDSDDGDGDDNDDEEESDDDNYDDDNNDDDDDGVVQPPLQLLHPPLPLLQLQPFLTTSRSLLIIITVVIVMTVMVTMMITNMMTAMTRMTIHEQMRSRSLLIAIVIVMIPSLIVMVTMMTSKTPAMTIIINVITLTVMVTKMQAMTKMTLYEPGRGDLAACSLPGLAFLPVPDPPAAEPY